MPKIRALVSSKTAQPVFIDTLLDPNEAKLLASLASLTISEQNSGTSKHLKAKVIKILQNPSAKLSRAYNICTQNEAQYVVRQMVEELSQTPSTLLSYTIRLTELCLLIASNNNNITLQRQMKKLVDQCADNLLQTILNRTAIDRQSENYPIVLAAQTIAKCFKIRTKQQDQYGSAFELVRQIIDLFKRQEKNGTSIVAKEILFMQNMCFECYRLEVIRFEEFVKLCSQQQNCGLGVDIMLYHQSKHSYTDQEQLCLTNLLIQRMQYCNWQPNKHLFVMLSVANAMKIIRNLSITAKQFVCIDFGFKCLSELSELSLLIQQLYDYSILLERQILTNRWLKLAQCCTDQSSISEPVSILPISSNFLTNIIFSLVTIIEQYSSQQKPIIESQQNQKYRIFELILSQPTSHNILITDHNIHRKLQLILHRQLRKIVSTPNRQNNMKNICIMRVYKKYCKIVLKEEHALKSSIALIMAAQMPELLSKDILQSECKEKKKDDQCLDQFYYQSDRNHRQKIYSQQCDFPDQYFNQLISDFANYLRSAITADHNSKLEFLNKVNKIFKSVNLSLQKAMVQHFLQLNQTNNFVLYQFKQTSQNYFTYCLPYAITADILFPQSIVSPYLAINPETVVRCLSASIISNNQYHQLFYHQLKIALIASKQSLTLQSSVATYVTLQVHKFIQNATHNQRRQLVVGLYEYSIRVGCSEAGRVALLLCIEIVAATSFYRDNEEEFEHRIRAQTVEGFLKCIVIKKDNFVRCVPLCCCVFVIVHCDYRNIRFAEVLRRQKYFLKEIRLCLESLIDKNCQEKQVSDLQKIMMKIVMIALGRTLHLLLLENLEREIEEWKLVWSKAIKYFVQQIERNNKYTKLEEIFTHKRRSTVVEQDHNEVRNEYYLMTKNISKNTIGNQSGQSKPTENIEDNYPLGCRGLLQFDEVSLLRKIDSEFDLSQSDGHYERVHNQIRLIRTVKH